MPQNNPFKLGANPTDVAYQTLNTARGGMTIELFCQHFLGDYTPPQDFSTTSYRNINYITAQTNNSRGRLSDIFDFICGNGGLWDVLETFATDANQSPAQARDLAGNQSAAGVYSMDCGKMRQNIITLYNTFEQTGSNSLVEYPDTQHVWITWYRAATARGDNTDVPAMHMNAQIQINQIVDLITNAGFSLRHFSAWFANLGLFAGFLNHFTYEFAKNITISRYDYLCSPALRWASPKYLTDTERTVMNTIRPTLLRNAAQNQQDDSQLITTDVSYTNAFIGRRS